MVKEKIKHEIKEVKRRLEFLNRTMENRFLLDDLKFWIIMLIANMYIALDKWVWGLAWLGLAIIVFFVNNYFKDKYKEIITLNMVVMTL